MQCVCRVSLVCIVHTRHGDPLGIPWRRAGCVTWMGCVRCVGEQERDSIKLAAVRQRALDFERADARAMERLRALQQLMVDQQLRKTNASASYPPALIATASSGGSVSPTVGRSPTSSVVLGSQSGSRPPLASTRGTARPWMHASIEAQASESTVPSAALVSRPVSPMDSFLDDHGGRADGDRLLTGETRPKSVSPIGYRRGGQDKGLRPDTVVSRNRSPTRRRRNSARQSLSATWASGSQTLSTNGDRDRGDDGTRSSVMEGGAGNDDDEDEDVDNGDRDGDGEDGASEALSELEYNMRVKRHILALNAGGGMKYGPRADWSDSLARAGARVAAAGDGEGHDSNGKKILFVVAKTTRQGGGGGGGGYGNAGGAVIRRPFEECGGSGGDDDDKFGNSDDYGSGGEDTAYLPRRRSSAAGSTALWGATGQRRSRSRSRSRSKSPSESRSPQVTSPVVDDARRRSSGGGSSLRNAGHALVSGAVGGSTSGATAGVVRRSASVNSIVLAPTTASVRLREAANARLPRLAVRRAVAERSRPPPRSHDDDEPPVLSSA